MVTIRMTKNGITASQAISTSLFRANGALEVEVICEKTFRGNADELIDFICSYMNTKLQGNTSSVSSHHVKLGQRLSLSDDGDYVEYLLFQAILV